MRGCVTRNQQPGKVALIDQLSMSSKRRSSCRGLRRVCLSCRTQIAKLLVGVLRCVKARFAVSLLFRRGDARNHCSFEMQLMHLDHLGPAALPSPTTDSSNVGCEQQLTAMDVHGSLSACYVMHPSAEGYARDCAGAIDRPQYRTKRWAKNA